MRCRGLWTKVKGKAHPSAAWTAYTCFGYKYKYNTNTNTNIQGLFRQHTPASATNTNKDDAANTNI